ncbi:MAG TPA: aminoacyl-tRNA hydrolase [Bacillota bacterium]|nr:aminoacyl-tRNA hydrolase [Bacillota bacterium]
MKCILGLGNPGRKYALTRHNVGFMVVDRLARRLGVSFSDRSMNDVALASVNPRDYDINRGQELFREPIQVILAKPKTYMNRSGIAVQEILGDFPLTIRDILVVHDDMDLAFGKIRFKYNGSSGGHKGIQSIIDTLNDNGFPRLKIGIGRPESGVDPVEYVLSPFDDEESLSLVLDTAVSGVIDSLVFGLAEAMNRYNRTMDLEEYGNK